MAANQIDPDLRALQEVRDHMARAKAACKAISHYDQAQTDRLVEAMSKAAAKAAYDLARLAVEETGIGRVHYKVLKNLFGSEGIWGSIKNEKTVGVIGRDERNGLVEVATPCGVVAGIVPTTNPTSTAIGKALIAVKGRNAIVISPHPRAKRCIAETVEVMRRAIERVGGPADLVLSLSNPTIESTNALMRHKDLAIILATGGSGLVTAAYSSGKPAYGVGPGNVPCYVDRSADISAAAKWIIASQSFDNATLCCSEQGLILDKPIADRLLKEMQQRGAYLCDAGEVKKLEAFCNRGGHMHPDVVGKDPWIVADMAGFAIPRDTSVLLAPQSGIGKEHKLSIEILCPLLSVHWVEGWHEGCQASLDMLHFDGLGHTCSVWAQDDNVLESWYLQKPANRILVNCPSSQGSVGYATNLVPSMSLGCGPQAGNITSDNITAKHLINIKRVARPASNWMDLFEQNHARAAEFSGQSAPRGSGLPGDPALGLSGQHSGVAASTAFQQTAPARPAVRQSAPQATSNSGVSVQANWVSKVQPAAKSTPPQAVVTQPASSVASPSINPRTVSPTGPPNAPTFTQSGARPSVNRAAVAPAPRPNPLPGGSGGNARSGGANAGSSLSVGDIQGILSTAGSDCPLGPCQSCPHMNVRTGACTA